MARLFLCFLILPLFTPFSFAQKEDNIWLLGGGTASPDSVFKSCSFNFSSNPFSVTHIKLDLPYNRSNTSVCDSSGNLLLYANGENIYNSEHKVIQNGEDFYPNGNYEQGYPAMQGFLMLPFPKKSNSYLYLYGNIKVITGSSTATIGYIKSKYAVVEKNTANNLFSVTDRDLVFEEDTLMPSEMTATRHGNGRDWWVAIPEFEKQIVYTYIASPEGVHFSNKQSIPSASAGLGQACFSPDGHWYARFNYHGIVPDSAFATFDVYRFDRCSGYLSEHTGKTYDFSGKGGKPGGVAFSPSSRYLYVSRWDTLYQYDLKAPDLLASEVAVAGYDGFLGDFNRPTRFYSLLLAPDNKIYCCVANNNSRYLHVIERPDEPGLACDVRQHSIQLPVFNNFLLPNMPYYRLWEWKGSPCDTLGKVAVQEPGAEESGGMSLYPNPADQVLMVAFAHDFSGRLEVVDMSGRVLLSKQMQQSQQERFDTQTLPIGAYLLRCIGDGQVLNQAVKFSILR